MQRKVMTLKDQYLKLTGYQMVSHNQLIIFLSIHYFLNSIQIFKMLKQQKESGASHSEKKLYNFFRSIQAFRTFQIPYPLIVIAFLWQSFYCIMPFMIKIYSGFSDTVLIGSVSGLMQVLHQELELFLENMLYAIIVLIMYITIVGSYVLTVFFLVKTENCSIFNIKLKKIFCIINCFFYCFIFPVTYVLGLLIQKQWTVMPALSMVGFCILLCFYVLAYWLQQLLSSNLKGITALHTKIYSNYDGILFIIKLAIPNIFLLQLSNTPLFTFLLLIFIAILSLFELYQVLLIAKYYHESVQNMHNKRVIFDCVAVLVVLVVFLIFDPLVIENILILHVVLFFFSCYTFHVFKEHQQITLILSNSSKLKKEAEALTYILDMIKLATNTHSNPILKCYFLENHIEQCKKPNCFCTEVENCQQQIIINDLIMEQLNDIKKKFSRSILVLSLILTLRVIQNPSFSRVKQTLQQLNTDHMTLYQQYSLFQMHEIVDNQIEEINSKRINLPLDSVIKEETIITTLKENISELTSSMVQKYGLMTAQFVRLNDVAVICNKINVCIQQIQALWKPHSLNSKNYSIQQDIIYLFYFQALIPSYNQAHQVKGMMLQKTKRLLNMKGLYKKNPSLAMYSKRTCVLQSSFDARLGIVINASKSVTQVLGVDKTKIIGQDIHNFMPSFFVEGHRQRLQQWITQTSFNIQSKDLTDCYTADKKHVAFGAYTYIKVHSDGRSLKVYKMIIRDNDRDYLIMKNDGTIEAFGSRLTELKIFSKSNIGSKLSQLIESSNIQTAKDNEKEWIIVRPFKNQKKDEIEENLSLSRQQTAFRCCVARKNHHIGNSSYVTLRFFEIKIGVLVKTDRDCQFRKIENKLLQSMSSIKDEDDDFSGDLRSNNIEEELMVGESSSCQTFSDVKKGQYSKLVLLLKEFLCNPDNISLKWRFTVSVIFLIVVAIGGVGFQIQKNIIDTGFTSFSHIEEQTSRMSSLTRMLQIVYNNALMTQVYCPQPADQCQRLQKSSQALLNEFYSGYTNNSEEYFRNIASWSQSNILGSYNELVSMNLRSQMVEVSSKELMQSFYKWLMTVITGSSTQEELDEALHLLSLNWPMLKKLTESALTFNIQASENQLQTIKILLIIVLLAIGASVCWVVVAFGMYFNYREEQKCLALKLYHRISKAVASTMKNYYRFDVQEIKRDTFHPNIEGEQWHQGIIQYDQKNPVNLKTVVSIVSVMGTPSFLALFLVAVFIFLAADTTLTASSSLITAENHLFMSFIQLKTFYLSYDYSRSQSQMQAEILFALNKTQLEIGRILRSTSPYFQNMDHSYGSDLNELLTTDVCQLTDELLSKEQSQQCQKMVGSSILKRGFLSAINFLQRTTIKALLQLQNTPEIDKQQYFRTNVFQALDDSLLYLMKTNQLINIRMVEAFRSKIGPSVLIIDFDIVLAWVATFIVASVWFFHVLKEREDYSNLCGYCLQLPEPILVKKHVLREVKDILDLNF